LVVKSRGGVPRDLFSSPQFVPHRFLRITFVAPFIVGAEAAIILLPLLILIVFKNRFFREFTRLMESFAAAGSHEPIVSSIPFIQFSRDSLGLFSPSTYRIALLSFHAAECLKKNSFSTRR
jgi:hypothetical protein